MRTFNEAERARLAGMDPAKASPEDHAAFDDLLEIQMSELGNSLDLLRQSHDRLFAAAKEALAIINHGHAADAWIPLEPAIGKAWKGNPDHGD